VKGPNPLHTTFTNRRCTCKCTFHALRPKRPEKNPRKCTGNKTLCSAQRQQKKLFFFLAFLGAGRDLKACVLPRQRE
jgi:hypothetical protein